MTIREYYSKPQRWLKHDLARKRNGDRTYPHKRAYCMCLLGALLACYPEQERRSAACRRVKKAVKGHNGVGAVIVSFNDNPSTTFADIVRVVRRARV